MNNELKEYLSTINNLAMLEPENLPLNLIVAISKMEDEEIFKACVQLFVLKNNIPSESKLINLNEDAIQKGATDYMRAILNRVRNN